MNTTPPQSLAIDQKKTAAAAKALRIKHGILLTQIAAESEFSMSMLYLMEEGRRKWTPDTYKAYVETIERIANVKPVTKP